jgi:hypothetical protein
MKTRHRDGLLLDYLSVINSGPEDLICFALALFEYPLARSNNGCMACRSVPIAITGE